MEAKVLVCFLSFFGIAHSAEVSVSINVKNVANTISDRFISYEINFSDLMNFYHEQKSLNNLSSISPAYVKLRGFSSFLKEDKNEKFNEIDVVAVMDALK